jgi:imidazolonepropionase
MIQADLIIKNAKYIITMDPHLAYIEELEQIPDQNILTLGIIPNGAVAVADRNIIWVGSSHELESHVQTHLATLIIEAKDKIVTPGLIDPHTHLVFAGTREEEFFMRLAGKSYQEILKKGGGILSTVKATRKASKEELIEFSLRRLKRFLCFGVTTIEIKSGYGLDLNTEIKILEVIQTLKELQPIRLIPTFLGAHAFPEEYRSSRTRYVDLIVNEMIPQVSEAGLAEFCDVFLDRGVFSIKEARRILEAGKEYGLIPKMHAGQFEDCGGPELAAELEAASCDHLEKFSEKGASLMAEKGVVAVLLPGAALSLNMPYPEAQRLKDKGVELSLSTDLNPGTSMTENLILMLTLACTRMGFSCEDALMAVTLNAAKALKRENKLGIIKPGAEADLVIFNLPDWRMLAYHFGVNHTQTVIISGKVAWENKKT